MTEMKRCKVCGNEKPASRAFFTVGKGVCKPCLAERAQQKRLQLVPGLRERHEQRQRVEDTGLKACRKCQESKPALEEFFRPGRRVCKACDLAAEMARRLEQDPDLAKRQAQRSAMKALRQDGYKACPRCGQHKPATSQYFSPGRTETELAAWCKKCHAGYVTKRRAKERAEKAAMPVEVLPDGMRRCSKCTQIYPLTNEHFYPQARGTGGLHSWCKVCFRNDRRSYRASNREHVRKLQARRYRENPEVRQKARILARVHNHKRRTLEGSFTGHDLRDLFFKQKHGCYYCGTPVGNRRGKWHLDHLVPVSRGGTNDPSNLAIACPECNQSKGAKTPWEFMPERFAPLVTEH